MPAFAAVISTAFHRPAGRGVAFARVSMASTGLGSTSTTTTTTTMLSGAGMD
jgi:hypothetical protein